ncbi:HVO_0476 family zinc finger protein [Methanoplanus limicola]|uniref:Zn-finger protein n=1 Tax=Methanoplanus limicola DSM 2279 TaxID=937775 RepID=H1YWI4_9EURY|nr:HVO_0476 family zinc finger protein [Methanoplanus limicola]EHQ35786.1 hypothetical protein Metlim_1685 [Methanoplanus limicola DSM 2279]
MNEEFFCPACNCECEHEILKESGDLLVKCSTCGNIHHVKRPAEPELLKVKAIVSSEGISEKGIIELFEDEIIQKGDLLVAEIGDDAAGVEVTDIEMGEKRRHKAKASDISALWTRKIDRVVVKVSFHDDRKTIPLYAEVEGEDDFVIGDIYSTDGHRYKVTHIKLRNGSMMRKEGWKAYARKIKRVYGVKP